MIRLELLRQIQQKHQMRRLLFESKGTLPICLGLTDSDKVTSADLVDVNHLLVVGSNGSGKSSAMHAMIISLLIKKKPSELKLVLIDTKRVGFPIYSRLKDNYLFHVDGIRDSVVSKAEDAILTLKVLTEEMERRFALFNAKKVRSIAYYNELCFGCDAETLPYIVVFIDDFSDLMQLRRKETESLIVGLALKSHGVGIHLIICSQEVSCNVITGAIRAHFPGRLAFRLSSELESRLIADCSGAEQFKEPGEALFSLDGDATHLQCPFVDEGILEEIIEDTCGLAAPLDDESD